jgi:hypothetical protein
MSPHRYRGATVRWNDPARIAIGLRRVHSPPNPTSGAIQAIAAFAIGYLLDRILSVVLRRRAAAHDQTS